MEKKELLYEGKAKKLYKTDDENLVIQEFKDEATAFDGKKRATLKDKGKINNSISSFLFEYLKSYNIPNHFERKLKSNQMLVKKLDMIPVEVVVRNYAAGSICKRYNRKEGEPLTQPIIEYYLKDDKLHDPMLNEYHLLAFNLLTADEIQHIRRVVLKVNAVLKDFFDRRNLMLVDFKVEFGRANGDIILADEFSPDTCRLWDKKTGKILDKDRFRRNMGGVREAYLEVQERILGSSK